MKRIGHRGAAGHAPENTLAAIREALELDVDMIELDATRCKTGETILIHDQRVDRTTNGNGYVKDLTFDQIKSLDAGEGERIPTLDEALSLIDRKTRVNIELKGPGTARPVATIIKERLAKGWKAEDFLVSSFDHYELECYREEEKTVEIGAIISGIPIGYARFATHINATYVMPNAEFLTRHFVEDAHKRGLQVYTWTADEPEEIKRINTLGVDGIYSNYPERIPKD